MEFTLGSASSSGRRRATRRSDRARNEENLNELLRREHATSEKFIDETVRAGETEAFISVLKKLSARCDEWNRSIERLKRRVQHLRPANIDDNDYYGRLQSAMHILNRNLDALTRLQEEREAIDEDEARDALLIELGATAAAGYAQESQVRLLRLLKRANDDGQHKDPSLSSPSWF